MDPHLPDPLSSVAKSALTPSLEPNRQLNGTNKYRSRVITAAVILTGIFASVFAYSYLKPPSKIEAKSPAPQDISAEELKKFSNALLKPTTSQTLTFNPNAHFENAVTIDKTLSAAAITTKSLDISGSLNLDSANIKSNLFVGQGTTLQGAVEARNQLNVRGLLTAANASFSGDLAVAGTLTAGSLSVGDLNAKNLNVNGDLVVRGHIGILGSAVRAAIGSSIGSGGSVRVTGNDATGTVVVSTGNAPVAGQLASITFVKAYPGVPHVSITPIGQNAGNLSWYANRAANFLSIDSITAPAPNTEYVFDYSVQR